MNLTEIALRTGVPLADLESLIRGNASPSIATRLGIPLFALQDFISNGSATATMAHRIGTSMHAAEELSRTVGPTGSIGIILGLLLSTQQ